MEARASPPVLPRTADRSFEEFQIGGRAGTPVAPNQLIGQSGIACDSEFCFSACGLRQPRAHNRLSASNPDIHVTRQNAPLPCIIYHTKSAVTKSERYSLLLTAIQVHALESL